jgi:large subunit ribosomal protein L4
MKHSVQTLEGKDAGSIELLEDIFGLEPRADLLQRCVRWQLAARQAGTHKTKGRAEIARTGKKLYKQKGTGGARHGSARVSQFRGGGRAFGPVVRSHAHDLPKKVRLAALKHALSSKVRSGQLRIIQEAIVPTHKTKELVSMLSATGVSNGLLITGVQTQDNLSRAASNIPNFDVLPVQGINVYDILRRDTLLLSTDAVQALQERLQ